MESEKHCAACGRRIEWRRKWAAVWEQVRYCSNACRKNHKPKSTDRELETAILALLTSRACATSICPSEAARIVFPQTWRDHMEDARRAARRLVAQGELVITQNSHVVNPSTAKGPIRIRRPRPGEVP